MSYEFIFWFLSGYQLYCAGLLIVMAVAGVNVVDSVAFRYFAIHGAGALGALSIGLAAIDIVMRA